MPEIILKNGTTLDVRQGRLADAPDMLEYLKIVGAETDNLLFGAEGVPFTLEQERVFLENMAESPNNAMWIGRVDGQIVSTCSCTAGQRERNRHVGTFALAVRQSHWNTGVGTSMAKELIAWARQTGILTVLQLTVRIDNLHAIRLYENIGFTPVGVLHHDLRIHGHYVDTISMEFLLE